MACGRGMLSSILNYKQRKQEKEESSIWFLKNGSMLLEELLVFSNGKYNIPIRGFSAKEVLQVTHNFSPHLVATEIDSSIIYRGSFRERSVLIKMRGIANNFCGKWPPFWASDSKLAIRDIVITSLMSSHKNVLKLLGCCLEFQYPIVVYDYPGRSVELLSDCLYGESTVHRSSLSWKSRLKIANDIANAVLYLHTAFSTPIIHRDLKPSIIVIDQCGIAKLSDFSLCVSLPPGETKVKKVLAGTVGYLDPECFRSDFFVTEKCDVFGFGMILLELLTGKITFDEKSKPVHVNLVDCVNDYVDMDRFNEIVDPVILKEGEGIEQEQQLRDFVALALRCTQENNEDRPEMIEVGRELKRIQRSARPSAQPLSITRQ